MCEIIVTCLSLLSEYRNLKNKTRLTTPVMIGKECLLFVHTHTHKKEKQKENKQTNN